MANEQSGFFSDMKKKFSEAVQQYQEENAKNADIYVHAPYAYVKEPVEGSENYTQNKTAYDYVTSKLHATEDQTDEARAVRATWSNPPRVTLENGTLQLSGTNEFLKSENAKKLLEIFKEMEGSYYNNEDLNKQIEAWNSTLESMAKGNLDMLEQLNRLNVAVDKTARTPEHHKMTIDDFKKIANSFAVGSQPDARTSDKLIFIGFKTDDDGNIVEEWKSAKDYVNEVNSMDEDKKREFYHDLVTKSNEGDAAAYSKLVFLQGGSEGGPANFDYEGAVGDFIKIAAERAGTGFMNAASFAEDYVFPFNVGTITSNMANFAEYFDQRDFWDFVKAVFLPGMYEDEYNSNEGTISDYFENAFQQWKDAVDWETAYFMELTPGSTQAAANTGDFVSGVLELAIDVWAGIRGGQLKADMVNSAISRANQSLLATGKFTRYTLDINKYGKRTLNVNVELGTSATGKAAGKVAGGVLQLGKTTVPGLTQTASAEFLIPNFIAKKFPKFSQWLADTALNLQIIKNGGATMLKGKDGALVVQNSRASLDNAIESTLSTKGYNFTTPSGVGPAINLADKDAVKRATDMSSNRIQFSPLGSTKSWEAIAKGLNVANNLSKIASFSVLRNANDYIARTEAGEDLGDMATYITNNTIRDTIIGGTISGVVGKMIQISRAAKQSPVDTASYTIKMAYDSQWQFYGPSPIDTKALIGPGNLNAEETSELRTLLSSIMTINGESATGLVDGGGVTASVVPGTTPPPTSTTANPIDAASSTLGKISQKKMYEYSVEPTSGGANIVTKVTDLSTGTSVTTKEFRKDIDEATKEAAARSIPTTSSKTLSNNDKLVNATVAPLSIDGEKPVATPKGVSQVKVKPGVIYRTPDGLVDEVANIASESGWTDSSIDRLYSDYERYVKEAQAQQDNFARIAEAPTLPNKIDIAQETPSSISKDAPFLNEIRERVNTLKLEGEEFAAKVGAGKIRAGAVSENGKINILPGNLESIDMAKTRKARAKLQREVKQLMKTQGWKTIGEYLAEGDFNKQLSLLPGFLQEEIIKLFNKYGLEPSAESWAAIEDIAPGNAAELDIMLNTEAAPETELSNLLRVAAWAKVRGYNLIPLKTPAAKVRTIKKFSMQDKFISKLVDKYNFPEIDIRDTVDNGRSSNRQGQRANAIGAGALNLAAGSENPNVTIFPNVYYGASFIGQKPVLKDVLPKEVYDLVKAFGWCLVFDGAVGYDPTSDIRKEVDDIDDDTIDAYIEALGIEQFRNKVALEDMIYRVKPKIQALGANEPKEKLVKYITDLWNRNLDGRLRAIDEDTWALPEWKDSSKKLVEKYRPRVEEAAKVFVDAALANINMDAREVSEDAKNISDIADPAMSKASLSLLKKKLANTNSKLSSGIKIEAVESDVPGIYVTGNFIPRDMEGKAKMVHIPEGTKFIAPLDKFGLMYPDGESFVFDGSKGATERNGELYLNLSNGAEYTPTGAQYELSRYAIYDQDDASGYVDLRKWLKPVKGIEEDQGETKNYWVPSVFNMVAPGGPVNQNNKVLRANGGKIPKDTLAERAKEVKKVLNDERNLFVSDISTLSSILNARKRAQDILTGKVIRNRATEGTRLAQMRSYYSNLGAGGDDLTDKEKKLANEMFPDIENTFEAVEDRLINETEYGKAELDVDYIIGEFEKATDELAKKWSKKLGTSKRDMSPWFRLIDTWGRKGSHTLNLPEGVDYLWTFRGNPGNDSAADKTWMSTWKPGDHINTPSLDFNSLNTFTPYRYSGEYGQEEYVLAIGHPNGSGLFYFGDPLNFGDRVHRADGGAIVTPFNMGMTVAAIRTIGKNDAGRDVKLIIAIRDNADGTPYNGPIEGQGGGVEKITERVREDGTVEWQINIAGLEYGIPVEWFIDDKAAIEWASSQGDRAVHKVDEREDILERPPVTTDDLRDDPVDPLLLGTGAPSLEDANRALGEATEMIDSLQDLSDSPVDYTRGVIDIVRKVKLIYSYIAQNVNLDQIYKEYGQSIAEGKEPTLSLFNEEVLAPLRQILDKLGHYYDPSGKSLTKDFYLPTAPKSNMMVSLGDLIARTEDDVDIDNPVMGNLDDILVDPLRIGDSGFWQKRSGELFRDSEGNFTMEKTGTLEDNIVAYTISALTRGKNKLHIAAQNEEAYSKIDKNRSQITSKQALAMLKDADTLRTKAKGFQAKVAHDSKAMDELLDDYTGDKDALEKVLKKNDIADKLDYTRSLNTIGQKGGFNQFLQMTPIKGSALRFGANVNPLWKRGTSNIRRKMEKINVTGTMYVQRKGYMTNIGFGLNGNSQADIKKYGSFHAEDAVNLGQVVKTHFEAHRSAKQFLDRLNDGILGWSGGQSKDYETMITEYIETTFPLVPNVEKCKAELMKQLAQNYHKYIDPNDAYIANIATIERWIKKYTLATFNNAVKMSDISNLDNRTINALDEAAAYMLVGTPVYNGRIAKAVQEAAVVAALGGSFTPVIGNALNEPLRIIDTLGYAGFLKVLRMAFDPKEIAWAHNFVKDLPSRFQDKEMVGLANKVKSSVTKFKDKAEGVALTPLEKSEQLKNMMFILAAKVNAAKKYKEGTIDFDTAVMRYFNDYAIAGGKGTVPGVATSSAGKLFTIFRTFSIRNFDDFLELVSKVGRGESGNNYWDKKYEKRHGRGGPGSAGPEKDKEGKNKFDFLLAARLVKGRLLRSYIFWLLIGSQLGKSYLDALGGDPTGATDNGRDRGLYDDPDTEGYEGMTWFDNLINSLPAGYPLGALVDLYFAARRRGVESKQFLGFDVFEDPKFNKELSRRLPLGVAYNRFADMLDLLDRGYSFSSTGRKTYAAPETAVDTIKGFLFGKATTENSLAYGKYRYGSINIWGDLSSGDWMDFAMNASLGALGLGQATFDTRRTDYTGVFNGSWNDVATMQLIIQDFKNRQKKIITEYNEDKYRYTGEWQDLTDEQRVAKAKEIREKKIDEYTKDVQHAVEEFTKAGNVLTDKQISTMMYLFDFHEGEEDDEWNSSAARQRYVEAGLPDYNPAAIERKVVTKDNGEKEEETQGMLDRSLVLKNAQQGFYGSSKEAAKAVKDALSDFKSTYKNYSNRVKELNNKYFSAREKNKNSKETKQLGEEVEKLQNEYLDLLFNKLTPVVEKYGTALIGTYDVADVLQEYMSNMIPYSSIKKYGQTYNSGNDIVYGQLAEWLQKRWGRNSPTAPSDREITDGIVEINKLIDQGKVSSAKSKAKMLLEKIGRGSLGARKEDVEKLRDVAYGR